jgi:hypothetical protein
MKTHLSKQETGKLGSNIGKTIVKWFLGANSLNKF